MNREQMAAAIRAKVIALAAELGHDAKALADDEMIPQSGYLDSPAIMGLIAWYEMEFGLDIAQEDLTLDAFGSVARMVDYAQRQGTT